MKQKIEKLNTYFAVQIQECDDRRELLLADDRRDEANFEKIRANVFDIFRTILSVAEKTGKDEAAVKQFFLLRAEQIPASWKASLENAQKHEDIVKAEIEKIKLKAKDEIIDMFIKIWEEKQ